LITEFHFHLWPALLFLKYNTKCSMYLCTAVILITHSSKKGGKYLHKSTNTVQMPDRFKKPMQCSAFHIWTRAGASNINLITCPT
jgi:hypothetical protein